jgi:tetratricopeptide (TPR) repeat protein
MLKSASNSKPKTGFDWAEEGVTLYNQSKYAEAIRCYDQALAIDSKYKEVWTNKGLALKEQGNYVEAIRCYDQALAIDSKYKLAWYSKGIALTVQGNTVEAIRCYDQALAIDPKYAIAWHEKGTVFAMQGNYAEAVRCYDEALAIDPKYTTAWQGKGAGLRALSNYAEAVRCYDQALAIDPKFKEASYGKGAVFATQGNYAEAMRCFDQALTTDPKHVNAWYGKGRVFTAQRNYAEAVHCYDQALAIDPKFQEARDDRSTSLKVLEAEQAKAAATPAISTPVVSTPPASTSVVSTSSVATQSKSNVTPIQLLNDYVIACFNMPAGSNFYHSVPRGAAEALLQTCNPGAFLFRSSSQANTIAVSYKQGEAISHVSFELLSDGRIKNEGKTTTMAEYFLLWDKFLLTPISVEQASNPTLQRSTSQQYKTIGTASTSVSASSSSKSSTASTSQSSAGRLATGLALQDYHQAIKQLAERERQAFLGLLQTDYQRLYAEYQRLGQQGFESNFQAQQQQFSKYLLAQQQKLQGQATQQQTQFSQALQDVLAQHQGKSLTSLSESALQVIQTQLQEKLGPGFSTKMEALLNSQQYQQEVQRLQQGVLQRIHERQGQLSMEMIHVQQKQQQLKNEHDPLFKQYQQQQQTLIEQSELQKHESVRAFYNAIEKVLGSRLMSAMSLASGMIVRETTKSETAVDMAVTAVGGILNLVPGVGSVASAVVGGVTSVGKFIHGKHVDKKQETKFKNTLDSMIRLEDAMELAELVARRLAQSYQQYITENYLSTEETEAAGENAANIVYGCIKSGGLKPLATKTLDEKVTHLVNVVQAEAQKQKGTFFRKGAVFKEPLAAQISTATHKQVRALGEGLTNVLEQNELAAKQAQIKLQQMEKEQAEMRAQMQKLQAAQAAPQFLPPPPSPQFLSAPASPLRRSPSPTARSSSSTFFNTVPAASTPVTFSLLSEDNWAAAIEQLKQTLPKTLFTSNNLQIQRSEKKLTLSAVNRFSTKEKDFELLGEAIKKMFAGDVEDWDVVSGVLSITAEASLKAKKLEIFLGQAFAAKTPASAPTTLSRPRFATSE